MQSTRVDPPPLGFVDICNFDLLCDAEINISQSIIAIKRPNLHLAGEETKCKRTMCAAAIPWEAQLKCQQKRRQYRVGRRGGNISFLLPSRQTFLAKLFLAKLFLAKLFWTNSFWPNFSGQTFSGQTWKAGRRCCLRAAFWSDLAGGRLRER